MAIRLKAFLIHLCFSVVIALASIIVVFGLWYPNPLHVAVGVTGVFLLMLFVDVFLGPVLTFVVYRCGKKTLFFDLFVIAVMQFLALGYGLWTVAEGRPVWLVFNSDRFDLVRAVDIDSRKIGDAPSQYQHAPWGGPQWVVALPPTEVNEQQKLLLEAIAGGSDISQRPDLYHSIADYRSLLKMQLHETSELNRYNDKELVESVLREWPVADSWIPLMANVPMVVLFSRESVEVVAVVELRPWL